VNKKLACKNFNNNSCFTDTRKLYTNKYAYISRQNILGCQNGSSNMLFNKLY